MTTLKELSHREERFTGGHRLCAGCGAAIVARQVLLAADGPVVIGNATGCLEVATTLYPYSSWKVPWIHNAFENVAATISGVETAYRVFKQQGKLAKDFHFVAFGGDGGTYDIGLQALSGALERGHKMLYVCYDNQAYMNTGIQRSGATPKGASTTTAPHGKLIPGKIQRRKDLTAIVAAHHIPYAAQAAPHAFMDLVRKVEKALAADGPSFINVLSPCHRGWRHAPEETLEVTRIAANTCFWPLYEIVDDQWKLTYKPRKKLPVEDWLKFQGRFKHLFDDGGHPKLVAEIQADVDRDWEDLLIRCGELPPRECRDEKAKE
ncbi:MAG TPA: thiamine pyrophosphate-dependent enzyme [bacterium]|nr:thiamine pyrophosphate-dependent enzyme [bacterium]